MMEIKKDKNSLNKSDIIMKSNNDNESCDEDDFVIIDYNPNKINPFGKEISQIQEEIREKSPYKNFNSYSIKNFIAKANDDLRQELLAMQIIKKFQEIFYYAGLELKLKPYEILITSTSSGLIEFLPNTNSIDGIKKKFSKKWNLNTFYRNFYRNSFKEAQKNFCQSLAAYSLICYYLQIKDRHNGNILIDKNGHIIHIDYGFILGISPGNINFENAPFKLTNEYIEILDGLDSSMFDYFKKLMLEGMIEAQKHKDTILNIVKIMSKGT
jgi:phosphatidylinositol kinase/protein kinase (PI-3  family)